MKAKGRKLPLSAERLLTDDQLKAVGCLAIESSQLEILIEQLIETLSGRLIADLLLERKMFDAKVKILRTLLVPRVPDLELKKRTQAICADIKSDIAYRNTAIHGDWGRESFNALAPRKADSIATRKSGAHSVKATELITLAHRFSEHREALEDLWIDAFHPKS